MNKRDECLANMAEMCGIASAEAIVEEGFLVADTPISLILSSTEETIFYLYITVLTAEEVADMPSIKRVLLEFNWSTYNGQTPAFTLHPDDESAVTIFRFDALTMDAVQVLHNLEAGVVVLPELKNHLLENAQKTKAASSTSNQSAAFDPARAAFLAAQARGRV